MHNPLTPSESDNLPTEPTPLRIENLTPDMMAFEPERTLRILNQIIDRLNSIAGHPAHPAKEQT
jgi:hypothetical protein